VVQAVGAVARVARANPPDHAMPYGHDLEAMADLINKRTRVVFIANPNNPTGTWLEQDALRAFLERVPNDVLVVIDEAYGEYVEEPAYPNTLPWLAQFPNLILTRTFSKAYGLAGLRVGYALSQPTVADLLNRVRQPFNVNSLALAAATAALTDSAFLTKSRALNRAGLQQLRTAFAELALSCLPSVGNFLCVHTVRPGRDLFTALLAKGVIVRPVDNYGLPDYLRVTVGTARENQRLIDTWREVT
ncbi:MAG: aminotransferase class I/II-fold pyridoxal phosphate-dependent enzyme, partial [Candidatus Competibacteraceae bacterium]